MDTSSIGELFILLFKSRRTFMSHYKNMTRLSFMQTLREKPEMTTWSPKKFNYFVVIKNNTMLLSSFM